jgi:DNA-binding response OmpR family regulator
MLNHRPRITDTEGTAHSSTEVPMHSRESAQARVLVIEDSPEVVDVISAALGPDRRYEIRSAADGRLGLELARTFAPDVVILDLGLPGLDGTEVCREVRTFSDAYVLILSARDDEVDRLVGLSVGADDYMTKPFSPRELALRVQVLLRRPRGGAEGDGAQPRLIETGGLRVDMLAREVTLHDEPVELTRIEFDLLVALASRPDMVYSRRLLVETVWGDDWFGDDHLVSVHVANLRKKIDRDGCDHIKTVRGVGYRMNAQPVAS